MTSSGLLCVVCTVLNTRIDLLDDKSVFASFCSIISNMKVLVILTAASFFLAGLIVCAPISEQPASEIGRIDGDRVEEVDIESYVAMIKAFDKIHETENGWSNLETKEKEYISLLVEKIQRLDLVDDFIYELLIGSDLQELFEGSVDSHVISGVDEVLSEDSVSVSGTVGDFLQSDVDRGEVSEPKQSDEG